MFGFRRSNGRKETMSAAEAAKMRWQMTHSADSFLEYILREEYPQYHRAAATQFLFCCGDYLLEEHTNWAEISQLLRKDILKAEKVLRKCIRPDIHAIETGFLHNIIVSELHKPRTADTRPGQIFLCFERMKHLSDIFRDEIGNHSNEVAIVFLLMALKKDQCTAQDGMLFNSAHEAAKSIASHARQSGRLTNDELRKVRDAIVMQHPGLALSLQREMEYLQD